MIFEDEFLFQRWEMLVPWRVVKTARAYLLEGQAVDLGKGILFQFSCVKCICFEITLSGSSPAFLTQTSNNKNKQKFINCFTHLHQKQKKS